MAQPAIKLIGRSSAPLDTRNQPSMAWKLKKATPERGAAEPSSPSAGEQTIDYSAIVGAPPLAAPDSSSSTEQTHAPNGNGTHADTSGIDFLSSRTQAAADAVDSFNFAKQGAESGVGNGKSSEHDDWSLDAFAPYQPPAAFDFNQPLAGDNPELTHSGMIDFDAEPETILGASDSSITELNSTPLQPSEFGVIDFDLDTTSDRQPRHGSEDLATTGFTSLPNLSDDFNEDWQLGITGTTDTYEATGVSGEPTLMGGMGALVDDFSAPPLDPTPIAPIPAFDEPSEALSALHAPIPLPMPELEANPPQAAEPIAAPAPVNLDKTLLYGEAADAPGMVMAEPQAVPVAQPRLVVRFGPFTANYSVNADDLVIGRPDPKTGTVPDVSLEYEDAVSRRHARVYSDGGQVFLEDLGSTNGTKLNNNAIAPHQPIPLKAGDKIQVGERTEIDFLQ